MPELVTAYHLAHGHWVVNTRQQEDDFREMVDCGFNAVALSFSEDEQRYARRAFELQVALARRAGLRCFVIPSRLGGRFAGAPFMPSWWLATHPQCQVPESAGWPVACLESAEFVDWIYGFMRQLLSDYDLDGIIWDEPKSVRLVSSHPDTIRLLGPAPTPEKMEESFARFLADLTTFCLSLRENLVFTLFVQENDGQRFIDLASRMPELSYFGYDGTLAPQSFFHEPPVRKKPLENVWEKTVRECQAAGKKTFALVENILTPASEVEAYACGLERYLQEHKPDHLALYFYGHNNEDPDAMHAVTKRLMRKYI